MYVPQLVYLRARCKAQKKGLKLIPVKYFLLWSICDVHANMLTTWAYEFTTITSVSLLTDFAIPSAFILSVCFLKIRYFKNHYLGLILCISGMSCSVYNDFFVKKEDSGSKDSTNKILIGDLMAIVAAFGYALSGVFIQHLLKTINEIHQYLGFGAIFGIMFVSIEAYFAGEYSLLQPILEDSDKLKYLSWNLLGYASTNFVVFSCIPLFIKRSGATLMNISNVTTVIWSLLSDVYIFNLPFYWLYVLAFMLEIVGVTIFSLQEPLDRFTQCKVDDMDTVSILTNTLSPEQSYQYDKTNQS